MLKKVIAFKDYEGEDVEREYCFHLNKVDLMELELAFPGGIQAYMTKMVSERKLSEIFEAIRKIVLTAYGERGEDGMSFRKVRAGEPLYEAFAASPAFEELMVELMAVDDEKKEAVALEAFVQGIMPKGA